MFYFISTRPVLVLAFMASLGLFADANAVALNDTGITACADASRNDLACPVNGFPRQDAQIGRDALWKAGKLKKVGGGRKGFDYTKLDSHGKPLSKNASSWDCVRDNVTGLVWENKRDDNGLQDKDYVYTWHNPNRKTNGGDAGVRDGGFCNASTCDTYAYAKAVNAKALCGYSNWRLPTKQELASLLDFSIPYPATAIDSDYFPNTQAFLYWTATPYADTSISSFVWVINFSNSSYSFEFRKRIFHIRLVRG